jgi:hypothetical protein
MATWNPPVDATEQTRRVIEIDMAFAYAESGCEELKARMEEEERCPAYLRESNGYEERTEIAYQQANTTTDAAFAFFVGNIVMTGMKAGFDAVIGDGLEHASDVDKLIAIVRAARAIWGTWE